MATALVLLVARATRASRAVRAEGAEGLTAREAPQAWVGAEDRKPGAIVPRQIFTGWVALRATLDGLATLTYLISLFNLPLANATAINMATPLFITVFAVLWLRARVTPLRWLAIAAGFAGVLLIIQPVASASRLRLAVPAGCGLQCLPRPRHAAHCA